MKVAAPPPPPPGLLSFLCACAHLLLAAVESSFSVGRWWLDWHGGGGWGMRCGIPLPFHRTCGFSSFCMHVFRKGCSSVASPLPVGMADVITLPLLTPPCTHTGGGVRHTVKPRESGPWFTLLLAGSCDVELPKWGRILVGWVRVSMYVCTALSVITNYMLAV